VGPIPYPGDMSTFGGQLSPRNRATLIGALAILLWSTLAVATTLTGGLPPLQLTAMAFTIAAPIGLLVRPGRDGAPIRKLPVRAWLTGVGGLFGYHFLYILALRRAPVIEANLVNYLWPILIVLMSALLPGELLRTRHVAGSALGFLGAALLITGGRSLSVEATHLPGYLCALGCALTWSAYSVLSRRLGTVPTRAVGAYCAVTAVLAWGLHLLLEETAMPAGRHWPIVAFMGLGPMGTAFYAWDRAVKRGDIRLLGTLAYGAPLLSTLWLIAGGRAEARWTVAVACGLVVGGAVVAAGAGLRDRRQS